jgi:hypothetical protein
MLEQRCGKEAMVREEEEGRVEKLVEGRESGKRA